MKKFYSVVSTKIVRRETRLCALSALRTFATPRKTEKPTIDSPKRKKVHKFSFDRSTLLQPEDVDVPDDKIIPQNRPDKEPLTPLAIDIYSVINMKGPITIHEFMSQTVNNSIHGYYHERDTEKIGDKGDFITSPEISQLFGEMIGVWIFSTWEAMGSPSKFDLIELGPGKGTLMYDILKVLRRFPKCLAAIDLHLLELSLSLRKVQYQTLHQLQQTSETNTSMITSVENLVVKDQQIYPIEISSNGNQQSFTINTTWNSFLNQIPSKNPCIIIGQEFLDAFPVHQFIYTKKGWREKLVDIDREIYAEEEAEYEGNEAKPYPYHFRMIISKSITPAVTTFITAENEKVKQFRESLKGSLSIALETQPEEGDGLEISPLTLTHCEDIATRVMKTGGASLLIDYGEDFAQEDTLRGYKNHEQKAILSEPGTVDITADVNFAMCRKVAVTKGAYIPPLTEQGQFLMNMGIAERVKQLLGKPNVTDEQAQYLVASMKKLVLPEEMGKRFKVLGIIHPTLKGKVYGFKS